MSKIFTLIITSGMEDGGLRATLALAMGQAAIASGYTVTVFLTGAGVIWGFQDRPAEVGRGFPSIKEMLEEVLSNGGKATICAVCKESCPVGKKLVHGIETAGMASIIPGLTEGPHLTF